MNPPSFVKICLQYSDARGGYSGGNSSYFGSDHLGTFENREDAEFLLVSAQGRSTEFFQKYNPVVSPVEKNEMSSTATIKIKIVRQFNHTGNLLPNDIGDPHSTSFIGEPHTYIENVTIKFSLTAVVVDMGSSSISAKERTFLGMMDEHTNYGPDMGQQC